MQGTGRGERRSLGTFRIFSKYYVATACGKLRTNCLICPLAFLFWESMFGFGLTRPASFGRDLRRKFRARPRIIRIIATGFLDQDRILLNLLQARKLLQSRVVDFIVIIRPLSSSQTPGLALCHSPEISRQLPSKISVARAQEGLKQRQGAGA